MKAHVTIIVSDMARAVRFYSETLGLGPAKQHAEDWVTIDGPGLTIGLTPASRHYPAPGTRGAMMIGIEIDEPVEVAVERLSAKGVAFKGPVVRDARAGSFANFSDPDGNPLYLWNSTWR
jgi:catechol 2,3-dioxygenase-like lactoylglutathione lyase family enzyme